MDVRARKLRIKYKLERESAIALVEAGLDAPRKVRVAKQSTLTAIPGIDAAKAREMRGI